MPKMRKLNLPEGIPPSLAEELLNKKVDKALKLQKKFNISLFDDDVLKIVIKLPEERAVAYYKIGYQPKQLSRLFKPIIEQALYRFYYDEVWNRTSTKSLEIETTDYSQSVLDRLRDN